MYITCTSHMCEYIKYVYIYTCVYYICVYNVCIYIYITKNILFPQMRY